MQIQPIFEKLLNFYKISVAEALFLYNNASLSNIIFHANIIRKKIHNNNLVSYIIDRNINYTNFCYAKCLFCDFCKSYKRGYILQTENFYPKIDELYSLNGRQILLQGGLNKKIGLDYYINLFKNLKSKYPDLKLHALSPPEIVFLSKKESLSLKELIMILKNAGLDSIPGGGAEILSDRVRRIISPLKCGTDEWLEVMNIAHQLNIITSATMMFGHIETIQERIEHLYLIRKLQDNKPEYSKGFISFTIWPISGNNTRLHKQFKYIKPIKADEYIRMLAISRLFLLNIPNIQVSWLTVGKQVAGLCLFAGANDLSSIMIEENVISSTGQNNKLNEKQIIDLIKSLGFKPFKRNQEYEKEF